MVMRSHAGDWWHAATVITHAKLIIRQKTSTHALSFQLCLTEMLTLEQKVHVMEYLTLLYLPDITK